MAHHRDQRPIGSRSLETEAFGSVPPQHQPRRKVGFLRRVLNLLLLIAALALIGGLGYGVLTWSGVGGSDVAAGTTVQVVIPKNANANDITGILADKGVIGSEAMFRARLKLKGDGADFHSGTYKMKTGASYDSIVRALNTAPVAAPTFDVTIVEGQRLEETAAAIDAKRSSVIAQGGTPRPVFTGKQYLAAVAKLRPSADLKAPAGTTSMEGLLFPATYQLKLNDTAEAFVAKQQAAFAQNLATIDMTRAKAGNLTPYEVVIIASLIEREAKLDKERPLVAAVIYNRLKDGMTLGIDASNQYLAYKPGAKEFWVSELLQSQLDVESPYNLRKVTGLPPTPIAEPSLKSLQAAANPAKVDYLYYVAKPSGDGSHTFTKSYDEFLAAG